MALSDGNIAVARNYLRNLHKYDNINEQCNKIKELLDTNTNYYTFCVGTGIGSQFNDKINELIQILSKLSSTTDSLVASTERYLNNQAEINRRARMESAGGSNG